MNSRTQRIGVFGNRPPMWVGEMYWWSLKRRLIQLMVVIARGVRDNTAWWKMDNHRHGAHRDVHDTKIVLINLEKPLPMEVCFASSLLARTIPSSKTE